MKRTVKWLLKRTNTENWQWRIYTKLVVTVLTELLCTFNIHLPHKTSDQRVTCTHAAWPRCSKTQCINLVVLCMCMCACACVCIHIHCIFTYFLILFTTFCQFVIAHNLCTVGYSVKQGTCDTVTSNFWYFTSYDQHSYWENKPAISHCCYFVGPVLTNN